MTNIANPVQFSHSSCLFKKGVRFDNIFNAFLRSTADTSSSLNLAIKAARKIYSCRDNKKMASPFIQSPNVSVNVLLVEHGITENPIAFASSHLSVFCILLHLSVKYVCASVKCIKVMQSSFPTARLIGSV